MLSVVLTNNATNPKITLHEPTCKSPIKSCSNNTLQEDYKKLRLQENKNEKAKEILPISRSVGLGFLEIFYFSLR